MRNDHDGREKKNKTRNMFLDSKFFSANFFWQTFFFTKILLDKKQQQKARTKMK